MIITAGTRNLLLFSLICFAGNGNATCEKQSLSNGDWQDQVLSAERRKQILEAELKQTLQHISDCSNSKKNEESSKNQTAGVGSVGESATPILEGSNAAEGTTLDSSRPQAGGAARFETPSEEKVASEVDELKRALLEAMNKETDPIKKQALVERYQELFES